ncbi:uncharacterized protein LOC143549198 [Bidens hawaiensis]|uniref:uncharacterized protein LOC143549198 n=1 Tax=Bidens hawaiensis TaxID=980011 RepID=UPI00404B43FC
MSRVLFDLGVGVSILLGGLCDQYDFGPLKRVETTVVLANLSHKLPHGIVRDVIVKVEDFYYPVDFLVLDSSSGENETLPAIIASNLEEDQERALVKVLEAHKAAIGKMLADLKGISPSIVMHKIITDEEAKPTRETQRRLNPNLREVVKKEDVPFEFTDECLQALDYIKEKLVQAPILQSPDWSKPFEIMCDASDSTVGEGCENVVADHLSRITLDGVDDPMEINEKFPDEQLLVVSTAPWYAHYVNYLATAATREYWSKKRRQQFMARVKQYIWVESDLFKVGADQVLKDVYPRVKCKRF